MFTSSYLGDLILLATIVMIGGHIVFLMKRKRFFVFDPLNVFWAGSAVVYLQQPLSHGETFIFWYGESTFCWTLFWGLFGFAMVIWGYESKLGFKLMRFVPQAPYYLDPGRFRVAVMGLLGASLFAYGLMFVSAGGVGAWVSQGRGDTQAHNLPDWLYLLVNLKYLLPGATAILLFHVQMHRVSPIMKFMAWCFGAMVMLWFIYLGTRSRIIILSMGMLAAIYLPKRRNPPYSVLAVLCLVLVMLMPFLAAYRGNFTDLSFNLNRIKWNEVKHVILPSFLVGSDPSAKHHPTYRSSEFGVVLATIDLVPRKVDFSYGYQMLELVTKPVPRRIWPDKRYPHYESVTPIWEYYTISQNWVKYAKVPVLVGPAFPFVAYWWLVLGPIGLLVGGVCTGAAFRMIRNIFDRAPGSQGDLLVYLVLMAVPFGEALATPLFHLYYLIPLFIGVLVLLWFARSRWPAPAA